MDDIISINNEISYIAWSISRIVELLKLNNNINNDSSNNKIFVIVFNDINDNDDVYLILLMINYLVFFKYNNENNDNNENIITIVVNDEQIVDTIKTSILIITSHISQIKSNSNNLRLNKINVTNSIPIDSYHIIDINPKSRKDNDNLSIYDTITILSKDNPLNEYVDNNLYQATLTCILSNKKIIITRKIISKDENDFDLIQILSSSIEAVRHFLICIDFSVLIPELVPCTPKKNNAKLVFEGSEKSSNEDNTKTSSDNKSHSLIVWTEPGPSSSLDYLLSLLRVSKYSIQSYIYMCSVLKEKILYLRNSSLSRQLELVESLELVFLNALVYEIAYNGLNIKIGKSSSSIFKLIVSEISRLVVGIDSHDTKKDNNLKLIVYEISHTASIICPDDIEINLILARCLSVIGTSSKSSQYLLKAKEAFLKLLSYNNDHHIESKATLSDINTILSNLQSKCTNEHGSIDQHSNKSMKKLNLWMKMAYLSKKKSYLETGYKLIENDVILSESIIWQMQRNFYKKKGLDAWGKGDERKVGVVPFFITSNSFIAREYSGIFFSAIIDLYTCKKLDPSSPIYIVELGAGHGKFSILFVRFLAKLLENSSFNHLKVIHIISDFTDVCFEDISQYSDIQPFLFNDENVKKSNILIDFAVFDGDIDNSLKLIRSKQTLSPDAPTVNPIFVVANYIFDSLMMDAYKVVSDPENGKNALYEGRLTTFLKENARIDYSTNTDNDDHELTSVDFKRCNLLWSYNNRVNPSSYTPKMMKVLNTLSQNLTPGVAFTVPIGGLSCLDKLRMLTRSDILITLLADKAYNRFELLEEHDEDPAIAQHGSLSMMVNLVAVGNYAQFDTMIDTYSNTTKIIRNGFSKHSPQRNSPLDICLVCSGMNSLPTCELSFDMGFCEIGIHDVFVLRDHCEDVIIAKRNQNLLTVVREEIVDYPSLESISILGGMCSWDYDMIFQFGNAIKYDIKHYDDNCNDNRKLLALRCIRAALTMIDLGIVKQFDVRDEARMGLNEISKAFENLNI